MKEGEHEVRQGNGEQNSEWSRAVLPEIPSPTIKRKELAHLKAYIVLN